ncbi:MAG: glycosyltransferase family 2 protein [Bacteroidales bacterium]|jgi:glycosyltransferase involved in cell wall biosynthesis|nr:glycosyltransferase family 2 protein [Bacteroidales bacterium]
MIQNKICVIIPVYNNEERLASVIDNVLLFMQDVIVVNDGSTDRTQNIINRYSNITSISYNRNRGKGYALRQGFKKALSMGFGYAITFDADGQHYGKDLPYFRKAIAEHPNAMIIGCRNLNQPNMPSRNSFANKFSNFWFLVQTGQRLADTQTGFRLYPLRLKHFLPLTSRYEAELELLVRAAWRNIPLIQIPVSVHYDDERVTHFRPTKDFLRISLLNGVLCLLAVVYGYPSKFLRSKS